MKAVAIVLGFALASGCSRELKQQFVRTDRSFTPSPSEKAPKILVDLNEYYAEPAMRSVGVLQVSGTQKKAIDQYLDQIADAGAKLGCDYMMQADVFELEGRVESLNPVRNPGGVFWIAGDEAAWQFVCAVKGGSNFEAAHSYELALKAAETMRDVRMGIRVCDRTAPTGSHLPNYFVCSEMKGVTGRAIGMNSMGGAGMGGTGMGK
jgi:hypothetical protein